MLVPCPHTSRQYYYYVVLHGLPFLDLHYFTTRHRYRAITIMLGHPEFPVNPKISENLKVIVSLVRTAELEAVGARTKLISL